MAWTPREELDRVPSFTEQERRRREASSTAPDPSAPPRVCDSCGQRVDDPLRWRHAECPPPPLPDAARRVFEMLEQRRNERGGAS